MPLHITLKIANDASKHGKMQVNTGELCHCPSMITYVNNLSYNKQNTLMVLRREALQVEKKTKMRMPAQEE